MQAATEGRKNRTGLIHPCRNSLVSAKSERSEMQFKLKSGYEARIRWSRRGSCGESGCKDPECGCSFCGKPIGTPEDDPRWETHGEECCYDPECPVCADQVLMIMFRGEGKKMEQASFHQRCFNQAFWIPAQGAEIKCKKPA